VSSLCDAARLRRFSGFLFLQQQKLKPLIAHRFPLAEARRAHELLGKGGVTGKIVLMRE